MATNSDSDLLDRVRKLLAKAEDEGCTQAGAEAQTAKAAELMARYGIDRALLGVLHPETDRPADRRFGFERPWADVKAHLLAALANRPALPVRPDDHRRRAAPARLRLLVCPGTSGDPLHLRPGPDGPRHDPTAGARLRQQGEGLAPIVVVPTSAQSRSPAYLRQHRPGRGRADLGGVALARAQVDDHDGRPLRAPSPGGQCPSPHRPRRRLRRGPR
jgi:hypothetical protein